MIEYKNNPDNSVVELAIDGKLAEADFKTLIAKVEADFTKHGKLRVLEDIRSFKGIDPGALWAAFKQVGRINDISHAAVVIDIKWLHTVAEAISGIYPFEIKVFERSQIEEARAWLKTA